MTQKTGESNTASANLHGAKINERDRIQTCLVLMERTALQNCSRKLICAPIHRVYAKSAECWWSCPTYLFLPPPPPSRLHLPKRKQAVTPIVSHAWRKVSRLETRQKICIDHWEYRVFSKAFGREKPYIPPCNSKVIQVYFTYEMINGISRPLKLTTF